MLNLIKEEGTINKFDLMDMCGMSVGDYNQIAAWFKHRFQETHTIVRYDKDSKNWSWIGHGDVHTIEKAMENKR